MAEKSGIRLVRSARSTGAGIVTQRFKITNASDFGDYLVCRTWDGTNEGSSDVLVAKPRDLQRTPFDEETLDGLTYTYTSNVRRDVTDGSVTETWVIVPPYAVDMEITAERGARGGNDVIVDDSELVWEDCNRAGRAWAEED